MGHANGGKLNIHVLESHVLVPYRKMSLHRKKLVCTIVHGHMRNNLIYHLFFLVHFTVNKHQYDPDDDSGIGPSTFTDTKSTTFSEVSCYYYRNTCIVLWPHMLILSLLCTRIVWAKR